MQAHPLYAGQHGREPELGLRVGPAELSARVARALDEPLELRRERGLIRRHHEGRALEALQLLAPALAPDATPAMQCAAGQMALAIKQTGVAQQLFAAVQKAEPKNGCGPTGLASVAFLTNDWDTAS